MAEQSNALMGWIGLFLAITIFASVAAIVGDGVQASVRACSDASAILNVTGNYCVNATSNTTPGGPLGALGSTTAQYNATENGIRGIVNYTQQLGSAGTIAGLAVLVAAAVMILAYFGWTRFGR